MTVRLLECYSNFLIENSSCLLPHLVRSVALRVRQHFSNMVYFFAHSGTGKPKRIENENYCSSPCLHPSLVDSHKLDHIYCRTELFCDLIIFAIEMSIANSQILSKRILFLRILHDM